MAMFESDQGENPEKQALDRIKSTENALKKRRVDAERSAARLVAEAHEQAAAMEKEGQAEFERLRLELEMEAPSSLEWKPESVAPDTPVDSGLISRLAEEIFRALSAPSGDRPT